MLINPKLKKRLFIAPALFLFLFGCTPDIYVQDIDNEYRPPNTGQLDIYNSAEEVKRPYKTIKIIRVEDDRVAARQDEEEMKRMIFAKAKEVGADGLIITEAGIHKYRVRDGMGGSVAYAAKYIIIEAIVYRDK